MSGWKPSQLYTIIIIFSVLFSAKISQSMSWMSEQDSCKPSSCGNITTITYPFRLVPDLVNCSVYLTELACEDNTTFYYSDPGEKYRVEEIDYSSMKWRMVDAGLIADNYSSLPSYSPSMLRVTEYSYYYFDGTYVVAFLSCDEPVNSAIYLKLNATGRTEGRYLYVLMGEVKVADVADSCTVEKVIQIAPQSKEGVKDARNYSYKDVQDAMAYGVLVDLPSEILEMKRAFSIKVVILRFVEYVIRITFEKEHENYYIPLVIWVVILKNLWLLPLVWFILIFKCKRMSHGETDKIESFLQSHNDIIPIRYSHLDIMRITSSFSEKLGEGGYGSVFKGKLKSGQIVAVKLLDMPKSNGQDFMNEVATIGTIYHFNIVRLVGYSAERSRRALVYDYMPNGSLEKYIFPTQGNLSLSCGKMYEISLGVARGIEYLHRGCDMQILHFDIKPHNILLDRSFNPKVSDFGLAKLYRTDDSIVSLTAARGTMGYMAPELFYKNLGGISYKADVYSFGMLLMEMAGRRQNVDAFAKNMSEIYFPSWAYDQLKEGMEIEVEEAVTESEREIVKKMIIVALWCIQMKPSDRPSMSKVVEMLEGSFELLQMPPKPSLNPILNDVENASPEV